MDLTDGRVEQTYNQIGQMIFDEVEDALIAPVEEGGGGRVERAYARAIATKVRDGVLSQFDAAE